MTTTLLSTWNDHICARLGETVTPYSKHHTTTTRPAAKTIKWVSWKRISKHKSQVKAEEIRYLLQHENVRYYYCYLYHLTIIAAENKIMTNPKKRVGEKKVIEKAENGWWWWCWWIEKEDVVDNGSIWWGRGKWKQNVIFVINDRPPERKSYPFLLAAQSDGSRW